VKERIAKVLAHAGVGSRREAERLIAAGRIALNGMRVSTPATLVGADDRIELDGNPIALAQATRVWRYHKPTGLVTTTRDPQRRSTVFAALPAAMPRVVSVGRLDINTEGLLLLTSDGDLARYLEHPMNQVARTYRVRVYGNLDNSALARLAEGLTIDGVRYRPVRASLDRRRGSHCWLSMTLNEGKNREIRKILEALGLRVTRLIRISYGPFDLANLRRGMVEEVPIRNLPRLLPGYFGSR
jgi:23S rRNA pseudouridine2605 synthase